MDNRQGNSMSDLTVKRRPVSGSNTTESLVIEHADSHFVVITIKDGKLVVDGYGKDEIVPRESFILENVE